MGQGASGVLQAFQICFQSVGLGTLWNCTVFILNVLQNLTVPGLRFKCDTWNALKL